MLEGGAEGGAVPGLSHGLGGGADFVLHVTDGSLAGLPGDVVDGFVDMGVGVLFLLAEVISEAGQPNVFDPAADGIGFIGRGDRGQDNRHFGEGGAERHGLEAGGAGEGAGFDDGAVGQGDATLLHNQVGQVFGRMGAILVIPFVQADIKAGLTDVAQADHAGVGVVHPWRAGDDHRVDKGAADGHAYPIVGHRNFAHFNVQGRCRWLGLDGDAGGAGAFGASVVGHLQAGDKGGLGGVGVGGGFAGGGGTVAEVPGVGGDGAVTVG